MDFNEIIKLVNFLSPILLVTGFCIGVYLYKSLDDINKCITWYMFMMFVVDISSRIYGHHTGNNLIILLIYSLTELVLFMMLYYNFLFKARHRLIMGLGIVAVLYILYEIILNEIEAKQFQSYAKVIDNFIVITLALGFFHEKINIYKESKWDNFRFNTVILLFFSINMLFFLPINFLINETTGLRHYFWLGNLIITVSFYLYLTHSVWKNGRTQKLLPSGLR